PLDGSTSPTPLTTDDEGGTFRTVTPPPDCLCDLTPDFCDIDCCCDTADCNVANLSTLFTKCPQKPLSGVCVEKWLMFRANVDPALVTVTDSHFCINNEGMTHEQRLQQKFLQGKNILTISHETGFLTCEYLKCICFRQVDDVLQTYFSDASVWGLLRQPAPAAGGTFCTNQNPAKFLRSVSSSCTRTITRQSCTTDPNLNAYSYFYDMSLVKIPVVELRSVLFQISVTPQSGWPEPSEQNGSCLNVVKKVEFIIGYTGRGELTYANLSVLLADVDLVSSRTRRPVLLIRIHSVFQLAADAPSSERLSAAVGLRIGSPVRTLSDGKMSPLTTLGLSQSGECSSDPSRRSPILFTFNTFTGCTVRLLPGDCSALRSQIYTILEGPKTAEVLAMSSGSQPAWTRVITQKCPSSAEETCASGCILPKALSIRVLWARQGPLDLPQNYILGAKYLFQCQRFQCPVSSPLILTTEVIFADTTRYPEPPRGEPQPKWKFPFGFF
uniref:Uncharacterized protein n=1 Tax=Tetraodon nigroviridis TaxID=99883 RepID=H3BXY0_TETNG